MERQRLKKAIEILQNAYKTISPKAAKRLQKLSLLRLRNLPPTVGFCLSEATNTYGFGSFLASIAVCRICLEAALTAEHGKKERKLEILIDKCEKKGILSPPMAKKAHKLRKMGNNYVHMLIRKIAKELEHAGEVRRFQRTDEDVLLMQVGKESDARKANKLVRDIIESLYGA